MFQTWRGYCPFSIWVVRRTPHTGSGTDHGRIAQVELLKIKKNGQFPDEPIRIKDTPVQYVNTQTYYNRFRRTCLLRDLLLHLLWQLLFQFLHQDGHVWYKTEKVGLHRTWPSWYKTEIIIVTINVKAEEDTFTGICCRNRKDKGIEFMCIMVLLIDKVETKQKTYMWMSVWW